MNVHDFEVVGTRSARSSSELVDIFRERKGAPVRLAGTGSNQHRVPAAPEPVLLVSLASMDRIVRFEPDDQTCSVEPGVLRSALDKLLAEQRLCLPCAGSGTIGGLFASGEHGPLAPGAHSPRSLLLGLDGVTSDGTSFQSGARVVKSVAGFDLHKLFVGSRGRLFAATTLHLKLRPLPRTELPCSETLPNAETALERFHQLRMASPAPRALIATRTTGMWSVSAHYEGGPRLLEQVRGRLGLSPSPIPPAWHVIAPPTSEVLSGTIRASRIQRLLEAIPTTANFYVDGGGRFEVALDPQAADALLAALPGIEASAEIRTGTRNRRGRATPPDPASLGLCHRIKKALDPEGMLL